MDKPIRLSVILPVYNKFDCIECCIKSLLNQGVSDVAETIFVDDGSTDETTFVLNKYQKLYPNFIKVISKKNGGVSSARNVGIENAVGEWLLFVDPDDYLAPNTLFKLLENYDKSNVDIVRFRIEYAKGYDLISKEVNQTDKLEFYGNTVEYFNNYGITTSVAHMIRKDALSGQKYDEDLVYWEDLWFMLNLFLRDRKKQILRTSTIGYYYVYNPASVTNNWESAACLKRSQAILILLEKIVSQIKVWASDSETMKKIAQKNGFLLVCLLANLHRGNFSYKEIQMIRRRFNAIRRKVPYRKNIRTVLLTSLLLLPSILLYWLLSFYRKLKMLIRK
jgi:glycosyltransferase involved in cell wall biosynthesis